MASEEETRKNGDRRKVANAMHTRVSEFCHLFEKTLPAAAGSIIFRGQKSEQKKIASAGNLMKPIKNRKCAPRTGRKQSFEKCKFVSESVGSEFYSPNYSQ